MIGVDAAAVSLVFDGTANATLGVSEPRARIYDELQFTMGEGPCHALTLSLPALRYW